MYQPTTDLPARVIDAIAQVAAAELTRMAAVIPVAPAAELGRLALPEPEPHGDLRHAPLVRRPPTSGHGSVATIGLAQVPHLVAERLFGALELTVAALDLPVPELVEALPEASADGSPRHVAIVHVGAASEMSVELNKLDAFVPGATEMAAYVVDALAVHPSIAPLLVGTGSDEAAIAASHGARHLALTVVVAAIVLPPLWPSVAHAAIIGAALGIAAAVLQKAPMPAAYGEAALAKRRAEYLMPRSGNSRAVITDHVLTLSESPLESAVDFSENGLVAVLPNGIAVRSGLESGFVMASLSVVEEPPELNASLWDEIVEVSWHAPNGGATFGGSGGTAQSTPPWPGDYRVRVCVQGRDEGRERFGFVVWRAAAAEPVVHKQSDKLGFALRGEPVPPALFAPDEVYHWVETSSISEAATVTFVTGKSGSEVLRAFGADESAPTPIIEFYERSEHNIDPWVCVLDVPGGAVAVEFNGWQGSLGPVLRALSSPDNLVAGMYWNVNAVRRFSLARGGEMVAQFEPGPADIASPEARKLMADLDVKGRHRTAVGLLAATRFTGISLTAEDLKRIEAVDIGYPILPLLPELHAERRLPDGSRSWSGHGPLGAETDRLAFVPDDELRELAWWVATFAAAHSDLAKHPAVAASLAARALTPEAELLARRSQLHEGRKHHWLWMTLHAATNPDPLGAAIGSLQSGRSAVAGHAAELLEEARARLG